MKKSIYIFTTIIVAIFIAFYFKVIKSSDNNHRKNTCRYTKNSDNNEVLQTIALLSNELANDPNNEEYLIARGNYWTIIDETNKALIDFSKVIRLNSYSVDGYLARANMFLKYDNTDLAFKDILSALKIDRDYYLSYFYAGLGFLYRNDLTNALTNFNIAIEKNPSYSYSYLNRGSVYQLLGKINLAIIDFEKALKYESIPDAMNCLAWIYLTEKNFMNVDNAFALAEKAVLLEKRPQYLDTLACAYAEKGDFEKAIELEKEAYNLSSNNYYKKVMDIFKNKLTYSDWKEKNPDLEKNIK
ncbi:MAG: hypothetical protein DRI44_06895 [Chlamydiae bacterium]|nr:MAG: hypothetical protein DRI44_06895 [Chlamydiota bacterium]